MEISSDDFNNTKSHLKIVEKYYKIQKIIGKGAFGVVYKAFELCSGRIVAIKQIPVDSKNKKHVIKEIELLKGLDHPNIVKYYNYLKEEDNIYIIMEYLEGGTLKQYIEKSSQNINEDIAREIIRQLLSALSYLHYLCDICHRDIKPENIMFPEKNNISYIKLLDFGLSTNEFETKLKMQNCGTLTYMAPEQISNLRYSKGVDIWSVGIVLYMLLNKGKNPFYKKGDSTTTLINNINNKNVEFDLENFPISSMGRHFIYKLLEKNPSYRYTVRLALNHPWITLNKLDKIPMTIYDKVILDENSTKLKMLLLTSLLMLFYKKNNLIIKNDVNLNSNNDENNKNDSYENTASNDLFNMNIYEKNIIKINEIYEQKYKENREKMFLPQFNVNKEMNIFTLKRYKNKIENKKNEEEETNSEKEDKLQLDIEKEVDNDNKAKIENEISRQYKSNNFHIPQKSILKKNNFNISPVKLRSNKNIINKSIKSINQQGMTPDINKNFKNYDPKISNKLISFKLSIESKDIEHKNTYKQPQIKINLKKPIKLQSIKNNNDILHNNELMGKSKSFKLMNKNNEITGNNKNEFEPVKISKSTKVKGNKKERKYSSMERINKRNSKLKESFTLEKKYNPNENQKKVNYKQIKLKEDNDEMINKLSGNLISGKTKFGSKKKLSAAYLTSIRKNKKGSVDMSILVPPKRLFHENSILPPIQK